MHQVLKLHPESRCNAVSQIGVSITRPWPKTLVFDYIVTGRIENLRLSPISYPARSDELWQKTCFEAFVRPSGDAGYFEFNFSPSTQWAAYQFDDYRKGMRNLRKIDVPRIDVDAGDEVLKVTTFLELVQLPELLHVDGLEFGISAVIEETNGNKSYWALAHPPGKADFHHNDGFACDLSAGTETVERS